MRIGWIEFWSGLAGDMFLGALLDAGWPESRLRSGLKALGLSEAEVSVERRKHRGFTGLGIEVRDPAPPAHRSFIEIAELIGKGGMPPIVRDRAIEAFRLLGEVEARIHDASLDSIHFHEVGALDAIVDIVGCVLGAHELGVEQFYAGPVPLGGGEVEMAHGRLPAPAPATSLLLEGWPVRPAAAEGEYFTPTAAALLRVLARPLPAMPPMQVEKIGFGAGTRAHPHWPNLVRLWIGETTHQGEPRDARGERGPLRALGAVYQSVQVLETQIDDMDPRFLAALSDRLLAAGARDVVRTPVLMKKGRLGTLLTVICRHEETPTLMELILRQSTTLGIRVREEGRWEVPRRIETHQTPYGEVRVKWAGPPGSETPQIEFADLDLLSQKCGLSWMDLRERILGFLRSGREDAGPDRGH